eukprot:TRINITY_DN7177_c0_g1_i1.p1 TRINITY_DN7177_c0_g1~~TRINITY_DN7177_c0_g1_i1.p1  ORF type:complete len:329 (+),score=26.80 TRINITY_DN7177_c0_g1_i1:109-1095(+)
MDHDLTVERAEEGFVERFQSTFSDIPQVSKGIVVGSLCMYIIGLIYPDILLFLALIPGYTIPPDLYVWNLITAPLVENSIINVAFTVYGVLIFGKFVEPLWGSKEFLLFIFITNLSATILTFFAVVFVYFFSLSATVLFTPFCGFGGVLAGLTIALKQLHPEEELPFFFLPVRAKFLPILYFVISVPMFWIGSPQPFVPFGLLSSWLYLRYFQRQEGSNVIGDSSDEFSFASFFPLVLQPQATVVANYVYKALVACKLCKKSSDPYDSSSEYQFSNKNDLFIDNASSRDQTAQRRRELAQRAVDQRLKAKTVNEGDTSTHTTPNENAV